MVRFGQNFVGFTFTLSLKQLTGVWENFQCKTTKYTHSFCDMCTWTGSRIMSCHIQWFVFTPSWAFLPTCSFVSLNIHVWEQCYGYRDLFLMPQHPAYQRQERVNMRFLNHMHVLSNQSTYNIWIYHKIVRLNYHDISQNQKCFYLFVLQFVCLFN